MKITSSFRLKLTAKFWPLENRGPNPTPKGNEFWAASDIAARMIRITYESYENKIHLNEK